MPVASADQVELKCNVDGSWPVVPDAVTSFQGSSVESFFAIDIKTSDFGTGTSCYCRLIVPLAQSNKEKRARCTDLLSPRICSFN